MRNHGMIPPDKQDWLQAKKKGVLVPESAGQRHQDAVNIFSVSAAEALTKVDLFGAKALHTAAVFEGNLPFLKYFAPIHEAESQLMKKGGEKVLGRINEWKGDHYSEILSHRVASKSGEIMGQLPVYQAIGGVFSGAKLSGQVLGKTPTGKFVVQSLINAADGFLTTVATGADKKEGIESAITFVGLGTLGAAAKPFLAKLLSLGGRKLVAETMAKAAEENKVAEPFLGKLNQAGTTILNSISREKLGKIFSVLNDKEKAEVGKEVAKLTDEAEKQVVVHGKDVLEHLVNEDLAKTPSLAKEIDPKTIVKQVTDKAKVEAGFLDPAKMTEVLQKEKAVREWANQRVVGMQADPVLLKRTKEDKEFVASVWNDINKQKIEKYFAHAEILQQGQREQVVPGAANPKSLEFAINAANKYAPKIMMRLEGVKNKLLFAYSISNKKDRQFILRHLKDEFPKESAKQINNRVKTLYQHIQEMGLTGHLPPEDERGVFRSTKTAGNPTEWQQELKDEVAAVNGKLKNYPTAQQALKAINKLIGEN